MSILTNHGCALNSAKRPYRHGKRAEQQAETRRRIVAAAVDLHSSIGPAATNNSMIAERAGVQRHTFYAHFPDDRALAMACSAMALERDPLPDPEPWRALSGAERLATGLGALYDWYARNAEMSGCVLRDAEHHALTREVVEIRMGPTMRRCREVLGDGLSAAQSAMLGLMMSFYSWRSLVRDEALEPAAAVRAAVTAVFGAS